MKALAGFLLGLVAVIIAAVIYAYSGIFNVAAMDPHAPLESWALNMVKERSLKVRAQSITPPPMPNSQKIGDAVRMFDDMCVQCHGAPGKDPGIVGKGLNPPPPRLPDTVQRWTRAELFWIVKNGIKMTGMPAFGPTHSDEDLWIVVAFLQRLPNVTPAEYKEMSGKFGASNQGKEMKPEGKEPKPEAQQEHKH